MRKKYVGLFMSAVALLLLAGFSYFADLSGDIAEQQEMERIENAVRQAAIACYAVEGYYPVSLETLTENYSLRYNTNNYIVRYDFFADNVLPDIAVFSRR